MDILKKQAFSDYITIIVGEYKYRIDQLPQQYKTFEEFCKDIFVDNTLIQKSNNEDIPKLVISIGCMKFHYNALNHINPKVMKYEEFYYIKPIRWVFDFTSNKDYAKEICRCVCNHEYIGLSKETVCNNKYISSKSTYVLDKKFSAYLVTFTRDPKNWDDGKPGEYYVPLYTIKCGDATVYFDRSESSITHVFTNPEIKITMSSDFPCNYSKKLYMKIEAVIY